MVILDRGQIEGLIDLAVASPAIRAAYIAASRGQVTLPPVGHITFPDHAADCHIKYGHRAGDPHFVIKIATGFPHNDNAGVPTGNGVSLVMSARTGAVLAMLHDEMLMTDIRTGLGGAIASAALARADSRRVLVVGTGPQAIRQIQSHVALIGDHLTFDVWGRAPVKAQAVADALRDVCRVAVAGSLQEAAQAADIIVTATGSTQPLIRDAWVGPGTHITAVGADAPGKQELETSLVARADLLVADSRAQCCDHGELSHAVRDGLVPASALAEIGTILANTTPARTDDSHITIADLTGIAAQDIAIAGTVLDAYHAGSRDTGTEPGQ